MDWPRTAVNKSTTILCPYNSMGEQLERKCIWDKRLNYAKWENVSNNDICKKQVRVFVIYAIKAFILYTI